MRLRFLLVVGLLFVLAGGLTMQAYGASCEQAWHIRKVYWNDLNTGHPGAAADLKRQNEWAFRGTCGSYEMNGYGDYDRDHHWHDSDWWFDHDRGWAQKHHPTWFTQREHHDNGHGWDHNPPPVYNPGPIHNPPPAPIHAPGPVYNQGQEHNKGEVYNQGQARNKGQDHGQGQAHNKGQEHDQGHGQENH